jgi:hypothetical protein
MSKIEAQRIAVRSIPHLERVEISLFSHGTEMIRDMSEDEALQTAAEILQAIGANRESRNGVKS